MQKRRLGRSDLYLTPLALGTWAIGGPWAYGWGAQDDAESVATIDRALGLGCRLDRDRAGLRPRACGDAGRAIRGPRDVVIATKCGLGLGRSRAGPGQQPAHGREHREGGGRQPETAGDRVEGCSRAGLAIAWVLRRSEIASAIVGARSPVQIAETVSNVDQALSAEVLGDIERLLGEREGLCRERRPVEGP